VTIELESMRKKAVVVSFEALFSEGTEGNISEDSRFPSRDSNRHTPNTIYKRYRLGQFTLYRLGLSGG
jgi:hypothetical protein